MSNNDGAVFYVKPLPNATALPEEFDREGLSRFSLGLTRGTAEKMYAKTFSDEYEVRTYGPAQVEGLKMVVRYYFWEITWELSWGEWESRQTGYHSWSPEERAEYDAMYDR